MDVEHRDFGEEDLGILDHHGCYVYRLLHDLVICGENTSQTFARLLRSCQKRENGPMCPGSTKENDEDVEVGLSRFGLFAVLTFFLSNQMVNETGEAGAGNRASPDRRPSAISVSSPEPEQVRATLQCAILRAYVA